MQLARNRSPSIIGVFIWMCTRYHSTATSILSWIFWQHFFPIWFAVWLLKQSANIRWRVRCVNMSMRQRTMQWDFSQYLQVWQFFFFQRKFTLAGLVLFEMWYLYSLGITLFQRAKPTVTIKGAFTLRIIFYIRLPKKSYILFYSLFILILRIFFRWSAGTDVSSHALNSNTTRPKLIITNAYRRSFTSYKLEWFIS